MASQMFSIRSLCSELRKAEYLIGRTKLASNSPDLQESRRTTRMRARLRITETDSAS
jgi:hypothetical protein